MGDFLERKSMSLGIALVALFPVAHFLSFLGLLFWGVHAGYWLLMIGSFLHLYLTPPFIFRLHSLFWPLTSGYSEFSFKKYNPWSN
jgi:hypothetical protein